MNLLYDRTRPKVPQSSRRPKFLLLALRSLLFSAALLASPLLFSQTTSGNIVGTVTDVSGSSVANASVAAKNVATGVVISTKASGSGEYRIPNLLVGHYNVTASAPGFSPASVNDVSVQLNVTGTTNLTLQVGQVATTVDVRESAATIDTTTAQISGTFDAQQMADLPSASTGSGVINLSLLQAGVASSGSVGIGSGPSVGGQRPANNNFTIEGIDNNGRSTTGPVVTIPNDAVAEFTLLQNQFSPDFGHSSGGQFNQVVKSGTNSYHGSL